MTSIIKATVSPNNLPLVYCELFIPRSIWIFRCSEATGDEDFTKNIGLR